MHKTKKVAMRPTYRVGSRSVTSACLLKRVTPCVANETGFGMLFVYATALGSGCTASRDSVRDLFAHTLMMSLTLLGSV